MIDFQTDPTRYRHWRLSFDGPIATLLMDVDPAGGLLDGYELKLNSYDLGVDIELADAVQRLRFEHPEVKTVVLRSGKEGVFCAGANIRMLGKASHGHKVNFCKFTNETRLSIEDASENSGQTYMAAIAGSAAGGGYELAVTANHIMLIDDRRSSVSLPELPLLAASGVIAPTSSAPPRKASAASAPSTGGWSMKSFRPRHGKRRSVNAPWNSPSDRIVMASRALC
jgi:benzoyl-CoA-dihydrodiol lyase